MENDFQNQVKDYFRLFGEKKKLQEQMKAINGDLKELNESIMTYMKQNEIPAIEFQQNMLRVKSSKRTPGITKKMIQECSFFQNDEVRERFMNSLPNREIKYFDKLVVTKKT